MNDHKCQECGCDWGHLPTCSLDSPLVIENSRLKAEIAALRAALAEANAKLEAAARLARESQLVAEAFTRQMEGKDV